MESQLLGILQATVWAARGVPQNLLNPQDQELKNL